MKLTTRTSLGVAIIGAALLWVSLAGCATSEEPAWHVETSRHAGGWDSHDPQDDVFRVPQAGEDYEDESVGLTGGDVYVSTTVVYDQDVYPTVVIQDGGGHAADRCCHTCTAGRPSYEPCSFHEDPCRSDDCIYVDKLVVKKVNIDKLVIKTDDRDHRKDRPDDKHRDDACDTRDAPDRDRGHWNADRQAPDHREPQQQGDLDAQRRRAEDEAKARKELEEQRQRDVKRAQEQAAEQARQQQKAQEDAVARQAKAAEQAREAEQRRAKDQAKDQKGLEEQRQRDTKRAQEQAAEQARRQQKTQEEAAARQAKAPEQARESEPRRAKDRAEAQQDTSRSQRAADRKDAKDLKKAERTGRP